mmetsp:Transcript_33022/g.58139  ORF Transcript_33022/g.58139 Transcript_33022/m.58139 type:complete len:154 (-) Transcript_33022:2196-2657(-)
MADSTPADPKPSAIRLSELLSVALATFPEEAAEVRVTGEFSPTASSIFKTRNLSFADVDLEEQAPPPPQDLKTPQVHTVTFGSGVNDSFKAEIIADTETSSQQSYSTYKPKEKVAESMQAAVLIATDKEMVKNRNSKAVPDSKGSASCRCELF